MAARKYRGFPVALQCMTFPRSILSGVLAVLLAWPLHSQVPEGEGMKVRVEVVGGDTLYHATIREVTVFPPMKFRNRREERFYWKTVRDVKRTLPYARRIAGELMTMNRGLLAQPTDEARKAYMNEYEKKLFRRYEGDLRRMTFSQGKMLIRLIDRECDNTSYDLIRMYRGKFPAFFWQGFAKIFGADLKAGYDTSRSEDAVVERIITLVEAGVL